MRFKCCKAMEPLVHVTSHSSQWKLLAGLTRKDMAFKKKKYLPFQIFTLNHHPTHGCIHIHIRIMRQAEKQWHIASVSEILHSRIANSLQRDFFFSQELLSKNPLRSIFFKKKITQLLAVKGEMYQHFAQWFLVSLVNPPLTQI